MRYQTPYLLWALPILVIAGGAGLMALARNRRRLAKLGDHHLVAQTIANTSTPRKVAKILLAVVGAALVIIAAARPQTGGSLVHTSREGIDLVVALDLSKSMLARDVGSSRLQAASMEIEMLLDLLPGSRIGLVPFAGTAFVQCPLTHDRNAIKGYLRKLRPEEMPVGGTAIGMAVSTGMKLLQGSKSKSMAILVFTDGEDHGEETMAMVEQAARAGITIYTVGIGTETGDPIPSLDSEGNLIGYKKDDLGSYAYTRLDRSSLDLIASKTGGTTYLWKGSGSVAQSLAADLNNLEKSALGSTTRRVYDEQFHWFLLPGAAILLGELLMGDRRRQKRARGRRQDKGKNTPKGTEPDTGTSLVTGTDTNTDKGSPPRETPSPSPLVALIVCLGLVTATGAWTPFSRSMKEVEEANALMGEGDYQGALEKFTAGMDSLPKGSPQYPALCHGTGVALFHLERFDQAESRFREALKGDRISTGLRTEILKGLGGSLFKQGQFKDARMAFTEALRLSPEDEQARHNLELSLLLENPPCSYREDRYESNDTIHEAKFLEPPEDSPDGDRETLMLCEGNDDWFKVQVPRGHHLFATALVKQEGAPGDFAMELYDSPEGGEPIRQSLPATGGDTNRVMMDLRDAPVDNTYFVRVTFDRKNSLHHSLVLDARDPIHRQQLEELEQMDHGEPGEQNHRGTGTRPGDAGSGSPDQLHLDPWSEEVEKEKAAAYILTLKVEPSCALGDDHHEPNDTPDTATPLARGQHQNLRICPGNEDYYLVRGATDEEPLYVTLEADQARGKLMMSLLQAETGVELAQGDPAGDTQVVGVESTGGEEFLVRITGATPGEANSYQLTVSDQPPEQDGDGDGDGDQDDGDDQEEEGDQDDGDQPDEDQEDQGEDGQAQEEESGSSPPREDNMEPHEQSMEHLLDSLTEEDRNFQLERAIEITPPRRVSKDW